MFHLDIVVAPHSCFCIRLHLTECSFVRYHLEPDSLIDMVLPTGAMGNLTGAYMAKQMGVPIGKLYCGVNINGEKTKEKQICLCIRFITFLHILHLTTVYLTDITHRVIDRGEFHQQKIEKTLSEALNVEVVSTLSSSMQMPLQVSSLIILVALQL